MDIFEDFMDLSKPFHRISLTQSATSSQAAPSEIPEEASVRTEQDYTQEFLQEENDKINKAYQDIYDEFKDEPEKTDNIKDEIYMKYSFQQTSENANLPIYHSREAILQALQENQIIVIDGGTGCGKSTQVPQFIIDNASKNHQRVNILVTQPRRIGARSLAKRVCRERNWELGSVVGYQVGLDKIYLSNETRILYCTTGVILQRLIKTKSLSGITHIILDEVHERDKDMDFLFIVIKKLLSAERVNTKIILMSATINAQKFAEYFEISRNDVTIPAPIIQVSKYRNFSNKVFYLDDLAKLDISPHIDYRQPSISDNMYDVALRIILVLKEFLDDVIENDNNEMLGSVLVFLPGIQEIIRMHNVLEEFQKVNSTIADWSIFVLHSSISSDQQLEIYRDVGPHTRKIILSTNIAESSLTVPDVTYVIDFCLSKQLVTSSATSFSSLQLCWASKSNCRQRSGRAGRIRNGRCYRLVNHSFFSNVMDESAVPELIRTPLENIVLKAKILNMGSPQALLALAMDVPKLCDVANTILILKALGALLPTIDGKLVDLDGDVTFIGYVMSELPLDVRISKLIILGHCFSLLDDCIIIGAGLSTRNVFRNALRENMYPYSCKLEWSNGSGSDLIALLNVHKVWSQKYNRGEFGSGVERKAMEQQFGYRHSIDIQSLKEFNVLVSELRYRLEKLNIKENQCSDRVIWMKHERNLALKVVIAGAFYPNYFTRTSCDSGNLEQNAYRELNGRDPRTTVYFSGFEEKYIRNLYASSIKELLLGHVIHQNAMSDVKVHFDKGTIKVFITFADKQNNDGQHQDWVTHRASIPGRIVTEVYKAVKMRKLKFPTVFKVIGNSRDEMIEAQKQGLGEIDGKMFIPKSKQTYNVNQLCTIRPLDKVNGIITHFENPDLFWFQPESEVTRMERWYDELNPIESSQVVETIQALNNVRIGQLVAAPRNGFYHRAKITSIDTTAKSLPIEIQFIDFGLTGKCSIAEIYSLNRNRSIGSLPPRCFPCSLAKIQPSALQIDVNNWSVESKQLFRELTSNNQEPKKCLVEAYSVVNGVARVTLLVNRTNVNQELLKRGYAEPAEENYMSKQNNTSRLKQQAEHSADDPINLAPNESNDCPFIDNVFDESPLPPPRRLCTHEIKLRGPFSPLERTIESVTFSGRYKSVNIDPQSINSVMLESNPQDSFQKYLVAAAIHDGGNINTNLTVRATTLMPNQPGFGALMAMIFAPRMEIMPDDDKSRYISILTGLGYDCAKKVPIFEEQDCIIPLDVVFTMEDITKVNQLRYCFDSLLYTSPGDVLPAHMFKGEANKIFLKIRELILDLLQTDRRLMELNAVIHQWNKSDQKNHKLRQNIYGDRCIFPMHSTPQLEPPSKQKTAQLRNNSTELHNLAQVDVSLSRPVRCQLCNYHADNIPLLRLHLLSRLHVEREKQLAHNNLNN